MELQNFVTYDVLLDNREKHNKNQISLPEQGIIPGTSRTAVGCGTSGPSSQIDRYLDRSWRSTHFP